MPGVGTVWFYPKGVANILSLNRMIKKSGWDIDFSSRGWRTTNNAHDLAYRCETAEGVKVEFLPTEQGLHVMNCSEYFGVGKSGYIFGKYITDNSTKGGKEMGTCHMAAE